MLDHLIRDGARAHPDRIALRARGRSLTYGALDAAADALAGSLAAAGVRHGDRVGILARKGLESLTGIVGALRAGAAFVPMDPMAPAVRHAAIGRACAMSGLVASSAHAAPLVRALGEESPRIVVLTDDAVIDHPSTTTVLSFGEATRPGSSVHGPVDPVEESGLAAILYTSGAAGPKGVMLSHGALHTVAERFASMLGLTPEDRVVVHPPQHFSLSIYALWPAFRAGATAVLVGDEESGLGADLARIVREERVTVWLSAPLALALLAGSATAPETLRTLRTVAFGGARMLGRDVRRLQRLLPPGVELWQLMGSTEAMGMCRFRIDGPLEEDRPVPVGRPFEGVRAVLATEDGRPSGPGEVGELLVASATVMSGYWGRPDLTAEAFVRNPLDPAGGELLYRSGDLLRLRPDGNYEFVGRRDRMVKTRGSRVDLTEVEAAIAAHPGVREVAVVAVPHAQWGVEIRAVVVPEPNASLTETAVKAQAARRLPRFMVPVRVEIAERLPRTPAGEIDRDRLARED